MARATRCTIMKGAKIEVGFATVCEIVKELDFIVKSSEHLQVSRSEIADAILTVFFKGQEKPVGQPASNQGIFKQSKAPPETTKQRIFS